MKIEEEKEEFEKNKKNESQVLFEVAEFLSKVPIEPSAKVQDALLNGVLVCGDVELGEFICDDLFEMESENTGIRLLDDRCVSLLGSLVKRIIPQNPLKNWLNGKHGRVAVNLHSNLDILNGVWMPLAAHPVVEKKCQAEAQLKALA